MNQEPRMQKSDSFGLSRSAMSASKACHNCFGSRTIIGGVRASDAIPIAIRADLNAARGTA
jgi:hypothetical protein